MLKEKIRSFFGSGKELYRILRDPGSFFGAPENRSLLTAIRRFAFLMITVLIPVGLASFIALSRLKSLSEGSAGVSPQAFLADFDLSLSLYPFNLLLYAFYWLLYAVAAGALRQFTLYFLGDPVRDISEPIAITLGTLSPIILIGSALRVMNYSWSLATLQDSPGLLSARIYSSWGLFVFSWIWEGYITVLAFKTSYGQNTGRAILVWIFPALTFLICMYATLWLARG